MDPALALEWAREAILMTLLLAAPVLLTALAVGLVVGALQTMTQLHDPTVSLVPRLLAILLVLAIALPWLAESWVEYARELIQSVPQSF